MMIWKPKPAEPEALRAGMKLVHERVHSLSELTGRPVTAELIEESLEVAWHELMPKIGITEASLVRDELSRNFSAI